MMTVDFMPMDVTTYLHCRRGRTTHRKVRIDIGMRQAIYNALPQSSLEIVDATGHVWSRGDIRENRGPIVLIYQGPPASSEPKEKKAQEKAARQERKAAQQEAAQALKAETKALKLRGKGANKYIFDEASDERPTAPETDQRAETKDDDDVQQVGGERSPDGETLRRSVHLQVPLVGQVDARLERTEERGPEGGSDGLHSSDDESNILDDRHAPGVRLISPSNKDAGRD